MAGYTDKGAVAEKNQDRVLMAGLVYKEQGHHAKADIPCVLAVCDGVGGYPGGEYAAEVSLQHLAKQTAAEMNSVERISEALENVNENLIHLKKEIPAYSNMLTTIAGVVFTENKVFSFHAGDSRVYRLRGRYLSKVTKDHSIAQEMIDMGLIQENYDEILAACSTITRCLGDRTYGLPHVQPLALHYLPGEIYMVCSDGIWSAISFDKLESLLLTKGTLSEIADRIVKAALEGGSKDNLSICLGRVVIDEE